MESIKLDVVSGFLGAGKTTLIKRMIDWYKDENIVIIENEFGEVGIDGKILSSSGVEIKEISSGCICCSVSGDFRNAINEILKIENLERIIIEPTGVGKLSKIKENLEEFKFKEKRFITILDSNNFKIYYENFGEFYKDQIKYADIIFLNRINSKEKLEYIEEKIFELNNEAKILTKEDKNIEKIDFEKKESFSYKEVEENNLFNDENNSEVKFETHTINLNKIYKVKEIEGIMNTLDKINQKNSDQKILRLKGIIKGENENIHIEYSPGTIQIEKSTLKEENIVIIGLNLDIKELEKLFY